MNGLETATVIRESARPIPVIILTADATQETLIECTQVADRVCMKPIELAELVRAISDVVLSAADCLETQLGS